VSGRGECASDTIGAPWILRLICRAGFGEDVDNL
jgi:hypothetical protein